MKISNKKRKGRTLLALDIETGGLLPYRHKIEVITIREMSKKAEFYHINKLRRDGKDKQFFLDLKERLKGSAVICHNTAFDFGFLEYEGINAIEDDIYLCDTMLASKIDRASGNIYTEMKNNKMMKYEDYYFSTASGQFTAKHSLKIVEKYYLHKEISKEEQMSDWTVETLSDSQIEYAKNDVMDLLDIYVKQYNSIKKQGMLSILELEEAVLPAIINLNNHTLTVNKTKADYLLMELSEIIKEEVEKYNAIVLYELNRVYGGLEKFSHDFATEKWNNYSKNSKAKVKQKKENHIKGTLKAIAKNKALISKDFDILISKTKRAAFIKFFKDVYQIEIVSTDKDAIQELIKLGNPLAKLIPTMSSKIKEFNDIKKAINNLTPDSRIVTRFNQIGAITGRMSSSGIGSGKEKVGINMQQINRDPKFRDIFEAAENNLLVCADYSGMELRIIAGVTKEESMLQAFRDGKDLHSTKAAEIYLLPYDKFQEVIESEGKSPLYKEYKSYRNKTKTMNFAIAYGAGAKTISDRAGISIEEATNAKNNYLDNSPSIKKYIKEQTTKQIVTSLLNRKMNTESIVTYSKILSIKEDWKKRMYRKVSDRLWVSNGYANNFNYPIQSTGADIVKIALIYIIEHKDFTTDGVNIAHIVHDEIILEVKETLAEKWRVILQEKMELAGNVVMDNIVYMVADAKIGKTWNDVK